MNNKALRINAEERLSKKEKPKKKNSEQLSLEEMSLIIHELEVHKIELEMQNDELQRTQIELEDSKSRYFDLYNLAPEGYLVISEKGLILESNLTGARLLGQPKSKLFKQRLSQFIHNEDQDIYYMKRKQLLESLLPQEYELRMIGNKGLLFWAHIKATVMIAEEQITCRLILSDISERKKLDIKLQQTMSDLLESQKIAHLGTWRLDLLTNQVAWSEELYKIYDLDPTIPPPPYTEHMKLFTPESWKIVSAALEKTRTKGIPYTLELETVKSDGSNGWIWAQGEAERDSDGKISSLRGAAQNITERMKLENELLYLCYHDYLTELHNRRFFEKETLRLDVNEYWPLSVIMYDVNGLKLVNDSFGHESGDALLKKAAEVIKKACRKEDVVARVGGDEFAVLLPNTTTEEALRLANKIKNLAANEEVANIELSMSYGYETKTKSTQSIADIIANAENHMYQQKLYERSSLRSNTIDFIMNTLFEKSNLESTHSSRVSFLCQSIATKMNLDNNIVSKIKTAGLIHDIGKIGVSGEILNKNGKLNKDESLEIKKHPEIGWRLLSSTIEFSELSKYVLAHHERWDGTGYPNKIEGEAIPIEARIIAVADSYDAMTSGRSYRNPMTQDEAIQELIKRAGSHFDPKIVDVFVNQVVAESHVSNHLNLISY